MNPHTPRGSRNGNSTLTESDVRAIRASRESPRHLAAFYGLGVETIRRILRRESWAWLPEEPADQGSAAAETQLASTQSAERLLEILGQMPQQNPSPNGQGDQ